FVPRSALAALGIQRVRNACTGTRTALGALLLSPPEQTSSSHGNTGSLDGHGSSDEPTRFNRRQTVSNCSHPGFDHSDIRKGMRRGFLEGTICPQGYGRW